MCLFELDVNGWSQRYRSHSAMKFGRDIHGPERMLANNLSDPDLLFGTAIRSTFPVDQHLLMIRYHTAKMPDQI